MMENLDNLLEEIINDKNKREIYKEFYKWMIEEQNRTCTDIAIPLRFLQWAKWNIDKAKSRIISFYKYRKNRPEWYKERDITTTPLNELINMGVFLPLKQLTKEKQIIILIRPMKYSPQLYHLSDFYKTSQIVGDILLCDNIYGEAFASTGIICIFDLKNFSYGHAKQYSPILVSRMVYGFQNSYPARIKSLVFINAPRMINMILKLFLVVMSTKLKNRIKICYSSSVIGEICDPSILPEEYGGTYGTLQDLIDYWKNILQEKRKWILEIEENI